MYDAVDPRRMITPHATLNFCAEQVPIPSNRKHFPTAPEKNSCVLSLALSSFPWLVRAKKSFPSTHFTCVAPWELFRANLQMLAAKVMSTPHFHDYGRVSKFHLLEVAILLMST